MRPIAVTSELHRDASPDARWPRDDPYPSRAALHGEACSPSALRDPLPVEAVAAMTAVRDRTLALVDGISHDAMERQTDPRMSPLVWDLAHIAAFEDLWLVHRHGGRDLLRPDLAALYDAFETPRETRGEQELLNLPEALRYLADVRERSLEATARRGVDEQRHELVIRHELQHTETMLQAMALAGLRPGLVRPPRGVGGPLRLATVDGGTAAIGAGDDGFAYDNERPRHRRDLVPFRIATRPLSVGDWRAFADDGGYEDRRWWDDKGWAWRQAPDRAPHGSPPTMSNGVPALAPNDSAGPDPVSGTNRHPGFNPGTGTGGDAPAGPPVDAHDDDPACHLSWFEARALCAHLGLRLPTEAEWEHAAASGLLQDVGAVWEWTATTFDGYPGFRADPYPEYSQVFFNSGLRVLRGGSFAAHPRVATTTFRNWDLPRRCQIFAGVRPAGDVA